MDLSGLIGRLSELRYADERIVLVYDTALGKVESAEARSRLEAFRDDHRAEVGILGRLVTTFDEELWQPTPELRSLMDHFIEQARRAESTDEALDALLLAERSVAAASVAAAEGDVPRHVSGALKEYRAQEERHVAWLASHVPQPAGRLPDTSSPPVGGQRSVSARAGGET